MAKANRVDPAIAPQAAEFAVTVARDIFKAELDFTPATLEALDTIIENTRLGGCKVSEMTYFMIGFGCYLGEVIVRNIGGVWQSTSDILTKAKYEEELVLLLESKGVLLNPLGKVHKRLRIGPDESVEAFYHFAAQLPTRKS